MWHYIQNQSKVGPVSETGMKKLIARGQINFATQVWNPQLSSWFKLEDTELSSYLPIIPTKGIDVEQNTPSTSPIIAESNRPDQSINKCTSKARMSLGKIFLISWGALTFARFLGASAGGAGNLFFRTFLHAIFNAIIVGIIVGIVWIYRKSQEQ